MAQTTPDLRTRIMCCAFGVLSAGALVVMAREDVRRSQPEVQVARANMDPETTGSIRSGLRQTVGPEDFIGDGLDAEARAHTIHALFNPQ